MKRTVVIDNYIRARKQCAGLFKLKIVMKTFYCLKEVLVKFETRKRAINLLKRVNLISLRLLIVLKRNVRK